MIVFNEMDETYAVITGFVTLLSGFSPACLKSLPNLNQFGNTLKSNLQKRNKTWQVEFYQIHENHRHRAITLILLKSSVNQKYNFEKIV